MDHLMRPMDEQPTHPEGHQVTPRVSINPATVRLYCECDWTMDPVTLEHTEKGLRSHWGYGENGSPEPLPDESPFEYLGRIFNKDPMEITREEITSALQQSRQDMQVHAVMMAVEECGLRFLQASPEAATLGDAIIRQRRRAN